MKLTLIMGAKRTVDRLWGIGPFVVVLGMPHRV